MTLGGLLLLGTGCAAATTQRHTGLREDTMDETVGPPGGLSERSDAGSLLVLLLEVGRELVALSAGDACALLQIGHGPGPLQLVELPGPGR